MHTSSYDRKHDSASSSGAALTRLIALAVADATVLLRFVPDWQALHVNLGAPHRWVHTAGSDQAATTLALTAMWLAACWLAIGLGISILAMLPGQLGRCASTVAAEVMPRALQRLIVTAAGISIAFSPAAALADTPQPANPRSAPIVLVLPTDNQIARSTVAARPADPPQKIEAQVTVKPGDSLWLISAHRLGPHASELDIATDWPKIYQTNRTEIGSDPALLHAGQLLNLPAQSSR